MNYTKALWASIATALLVLATAGHVPLRAVEPQVAGLNDLVVYDPGKHERGLPAIEFDATLEGKLKVEMPPTVHVHRYYYSGDKEFQGPILQGGATIIVANHPKTGCRMYVDVMLPPGAPKIVHNKHGITYQYPHQRVIITFSKLHRDQAVVEYAAGQGLPRRWHNFAVAAHAKTYQKLKASPLAQAAHDATHDVGQMAIGAKDAIGEAAANGLNKARQAAHFVPGVTPLKSYAQQRAQRIEAAAVARETALREQATTDLSATRVQARSNARRWAPSWLFGRGGAGSAGD